MRKIINLLYLQRNTLQHSTPWNFPDSARINHDSIANSPKAIIMRIYISTSRYYAVAVQSDMFGQTVIVRSWGGRWSRSGGTATEPYTTERIAQIHKERLAHGYSLS